MSASFNFQPISNRPSSRFYVRKASSPLPRALSPVIDEAYEAIKDYFKDRSAENNRSLLQEWKAENIYPYEGEPQSSLEVAERKVFDIVATSVNNQLPDFAATPPKSKALHLRMLRSAI